MIHTLVHITDVGAASGNGVDSTLRILQQYHALGVPAPYIVSAGTSPFHIAFAGLTCLHQGAIDRANLARTLYMHTTQPVVSPVALNAAPRNSMQTQQDAQEETIFLVTIETSFGAHEIILYGYDVLRWVCCLTEGCARTIYAVESIDKCIVDTRKGSQFRSAEYLPIAHVLLARGILKDIARFVLIPVLNTHMLWRRSATNCIVAPPDEYGNGRLIITKQIWRRMQHMSSLSIPELNLYSLPLYESLTSVEPGKIALWPSSNALIDHTLCVINIGTRWQPGTTWTTDVKVLELSHILTGMTGKQIALM